MLKKTQIIIPLILLTSCSKQIPIQEEIKTSKEIKPYIIPETITLKKDESLPKDNKFNLNKLEKKFLKDIKNEEEIEDIKVKIKENTKKYEDIKNEKIEEKVYENSKEEKEKLKVENPENNQNIEKTIEETDQDNIIYEETIEVTEYIVENEPNNKTEQNNEPTFTPNSVTILNTTYPILQNIEDHKEGQALIDQTEFGWIDFSYIMRKTCKTISDNNNLYLAAHGSNSGKKIFEANEVIFTDINGNSKKYTKDYESAVFPSGQGVFADDLHPELMYGEYEDAIVFQTCIDEFGNAKYLYFAPEY